MQVSKRIAVIGTPDTVLPFKAIGATGIEADDVEKAEERLDELITENYGIIFIEEAFALEFEDKINEYNDQYRNLSIIVIPGAKGSSGTAVKKIRDLVKRAIGIDIFLEKS